MVKLQPRQNIHYAGDDALLSENVTFHYAMTELRRLGGPGYELMVNPAKGRITVYAKGGHPVAYSVAVTDRLVEETNAVLMANGGDRPIIPSQS